jgi:hypothetical protein
MATLQIRDDIVYREVDGVIVAFSLDSGEYVALDAIGTDIWRLIEQDGHVSAIRAGMLATYDIDEASCDQELSSFITMLQARRLVNVDGGVRGVGSLDPTHRGD